MTHATAGLIEQDDVARMSRAARGAPTPVSLSSWFDRTAHDRCSSGWISLAGGSPAAVVSCTWKKFVRFPEEMRASVGARSGIEDG
ncbi:hypothetical protein [Streptomyces carpinensis]|uniref:hypothetical protein n=1 Tax=Streptomyces carpinensis TaxID=66369 RepID=UPI000A378617|nr:hypothetical protein [Streptomyces carpinensis]